MPEKLIEFNEGDPKQTSKGLPVVNATTVLAFESYYIERKGAWAEHLQKILRRMQVENPNLIAFIEDAVIAPQPIQFHPLMSQVFVATIAILEHQAEANKLNEQLK